MCWIYWSMNIVLKTVKDFINVSSVMNICFSNLIQKPKRFDRPINPINFLLVIPIGGFLVKRFVRKEIQCIWVLLRMCVLTERQKWYTFQSRFKVVEKILKFFDMFRFSLSLEPKQVRIESVDWNGAQTVQIWLNVIFDSDVKLNLLIAINVWLRFKVEYAFFAAYF